MKEKILIAIDSSDSSSKVLAYGINLAGKLDAEVKVVHVIEPYSKRSTILNQLNPAMVKQTNELYELAGQELMEEYPERKMISVDTLAASMGQGLLVYKACQAKDSGKSLEENAQYIEEIKLKLCHWFTVDDLFFLKRGGRISGVTATVGTMLSIKPILHVDDEGHLINVSKVRGRKAAITELAIRMEKLAVHPEDQDIFISHGDCIEDAEKLASIIKERFGNDRITISYVGPVIGAHSGPGTLALFFLGEHR